MRHFTLQSRPGLFCPRRWFYGPPPLANFRPGSMNRVSPKPRSKSSKATVLLVASQPFFRGCSEEWLARQPGMACLGADSVAAAARAAAQARPDAVLTQLMLNDGDALDLIKRLHDAHPKLPVAVFVSGSQRVYPERLLKAGARAILDEGAGPGEVLEAVRLVLSGQLYVSPRLSCALLEHLGAPQRGRADDQLRALTDRELEVFGLLGAGLSTRVVADRLHVSFKTVESHRENIKVKLGAQSARQLLVMAASWLPDALGRGARPS
jgi:DNA-binding NarL/FixJ family response regulator